MQPQHHKLRSCGSKIRMLPSSPPGPPDLDGRSKEHKCCALGHWSDEMQILDLPTEEDKPQLIPALHLHKGSVSSVDVQADSKALLTVGADGAICVSQPEAQAYSNSSSSCFRRSASGCMSYTCGRWADTNTFVTASALGGLHLWDVRAGPKPVGSSPSHWGPTGAQPAQPRPAFLAPGHALEAPRKSRYSNTTTLTPGGHSSVLPSYLEGTQMPHPQSLQVQFDPLQRSEAPTRTTSTPSVLCCSDDGHVSHCTFSDLDASHTTQIPDSDSSFPADKAAPFPSFSSNLRPPQPGTSGSKQSAAKPIFKRPYGVNSMDVEPGLGVALVAVTEGQEVVYFRR
ncbi:hypothetical protein DUNSADRAFT_10952 [Dunaliella salina]|uniref:Uncharacterized protein n=1 Tax=Dunaliella salina TaxID=3046 RepID=A0ABQ7GEG6_DUNSA|nr:hypothetical protein DUNSADRAFT_10952 [Dunaliella salina]|eukprot:KAF5832996.1 hypothetical protein DUNSADRAFT_10952 [Dunaliella salina]